MKRFVAIVLAIGLSKISIAETGNVLGMQMALLSATPSVVGHRAATEAEKKHLVGLKIPGKTRERTAIPFLYVEVPTIMSCTGVMIREYILTAAHCVYGGDFDSTKSSEGPITVEYNGKSWEVEKPTITRVEPISKDDLAKMSRGERETANAKNDVALLRADAPSDIDVSGYGPDILAIPAVQEGIEAKIELSRAKLAATKSAVELKALQEDEAGTVKTLFLKEAGLPGTVVGLGITTPPKRGKKGIEVPAVLGEGAGDVSIGDFDDGKIYSFNKAGYVAPGDSGGPLYYTDRSKRVWLLGIASMGPNIQSKNNENGIMIHTSVADNLAWIVKSIEKSADDEE